MANAMDKITSIIENIKNSQQNCISTKVETPLDNHKPKRKGKVKNNIEPVRGNPKSGRFWKSQKERFSSINKSKGLKQDFQKKTALRIELKRTKELSKQLQENLKQKEVERKERRRENIKRSEENKRKSEVVQVITNTAKLKRMRKKQLRFIQKRDTSKEANVIGKNNT